MGSCPAASLRASVVPSIPAARIAANGGARSRFASRRPSGDQRMMRIGRGRQVEQRLKQPMDVRRGEQVAAADHVGDPLRGVVHGDREVIARRRILAREYHVALRSRIARHACPVIAPFERPGPGERRRHVEPPAMRCLRVAVARPAGAGVRRVRPVRRRQARRDLRACTPAAVEQAHRAQPPERCLVPREPRRLEDDRPVVVEAEPRQILDDPRDMLGTAAGPVDILDPQQEAPARIACRAMRQRRRQRVTQMQRSGRARREAGGDRHIPDS